MHFLKLDLNLLVALNALLTDPHVTRAAERLRVSQSTLSGSLARLREYFDDELIIQVGRRMELTPLAQELREPLRELLNSTERLLSSKARFDPLGSDRCFTITCTDYVWATLLREVVARLATEAPRIRVEYGGTTRDFAERRIELLVVADRFALDGYPSHPLFEDPFVCIAWSGNTEVGDSLSFEEYFKHRHVVAYASRPTLVADWIASAHGRHVDVAARAPNFTLVPQSIVGTTYLATVPLRMANYYASHLPLRILQAPLELPVLADVIQWQPHQEADEGLIWLRTLIIESCGRMKDAPPA